MPGVWGNAICVLPVEDADKRSFIKLDDNSYPFACILDSKRERLLVSLWNKAAVAVIDLKTSKVTGQYATEKHPTEMTLSPDGKTLFVACSNSTRVSVLRAEDGKGLETINCALHAKAPPGNTPSSLCLTPDGQKKQVIVIRRVPGQDPVVFDINFSR